MVETTTILFFCKSYFMYDCENTMREPLQFLIKTIKIKDWVAEPPLGPNLKINFFGGFGPRGGRTTPN